MTPTKDGWSVQLRFGQQHRQRFEILAESATEAKKRADTMRDLARLLVESGRLTEAGPALERLASLRDGRAFAGATQGIRELCSEPLPEVESAAFDAKMTFRRFGQLWTSGKLAERYPDQIRTKKSAPTDALRLEELCRTIGSVPLARFTLDDADRAMAALPARAKTAATRRHYAQIIAFLLSKAVYPCRLLERSPIPKGFLPKTGRGPEYPFLYPSEDRVLCACTDIDLGTRLLYGFSDREGWRKSDSQLPWKAFDLEHGIVNTKMTKTGEVRSWRLFPGTTEALIAYRKGLGTPRPTALVFPPVSDTEEARLFRLNLKIAGITRAELFDESEGRAPIRFHDLRASFITIALAQGRTEAWITDRTGHTTSQMLYRYKRKARLASELGDWTPLDVALGLNPARESSGAETRKAATSAQRVAHEVARNIFDDAGGDLEVTEMKGRNRARPAGFEPATSGLEILAETAGTALHREKHRGSCTTDSSEGLSVPPQERGGGTQMHITDAQLSELLELSQRAKRWHLVTALAGELEARAERATSGVIRLDERRGR